MHVHIHKLPVHGIKGMSHCWTPIIDGKAVEFRGQPPRSVKTAKRAAAEHLDTDLDEIEFTVHK